MDRETVKERRAAAAKARLLAAQMTNRDDAKRLLQFAAEMEAQADTMERDLQKDRPSGSATREQVQVQQQQEADPASEPKPEK